MVAVTGLKLCPSGVPLRFVDEFHRGLLSGLLSARDSAREKLLVGVGVEYSREDTPRLGRRSATLDLESGVLRGIAPVLLPIGVGRLDSRFPALDLPVVLLAKLPALDLWAAGVETPWSLLWRLSSTTEDAGELPGVSIILLETDRCSDSIVEIESRS